MAYDFPNAPANGAIIQTAGQRFEYVASYPRWEYRGVALLNGGAGVIVPGANTWTEAAATLNSTGCVELSLDNVTWGTTINTTFGGTFYTRWAPGIACDDAPHASVITGTISEPASGATQTYTKVIDRVPGSISLSAATANAAPLTTTPTTSFTVSDINASTYLWGALTTTSGGTAPTTAEYSKDGGTTWATLPAAPGTDTVASGDTVTLRFFTGDTAFTTDTLTVSVGESVAQSVSATYTVTVQKTVFSPTPVAAPTTADLTTACFTWADGVDTIYATGCLEFNVNGGVFDQSNKAVVDGDLVCTRWQDGTGPDTTCADATHGTVIGGTIESATKSFTASLTIDRQPDTFDFIDQTSIGLSTPATSNTVTISGTNSVSYLQWTPDATNPLTTVQASINGGAYVAVPAVGTYTLEVPVGATVQVQGTTGATYSTPYQGTFTLGDASGSTTDVWSVTTTAVIPSIQTPSITSPANGATDLNPASNSPAGIPLVGDTYTPLNGAGAVQTSSTWEVYQWVGGGAATAPTTEPPDANYTAVTGSPFTVTSAPFTTYNVAQSALTTSSTYYARVQYATTNATAATSSFSAWSSFTTASSFAIPPGTPMGGGYFGGQINDGGTIYNLIVAPTSSGSLNGEYPGSVQYKTTNSSDAGQADNQSWGAPMTTTFFGGPYPLFNWCMTSGTGPNAGTYNAANTTGTGIGGFNDWYIPAKNELAIIYFFLKPTTNGNLTAPLSGSNANSVAPYTPNTSYGTGFPDQTTSALFQGAQAFNSTFPNSYWSTTQDGGAGGSAWGQDFRDGQQFIGNKSNNRLGRAIRRVPA